MGLGTFDVQTGKFNLYLSARHAADVGVIRQWKAAFQNASELLYGATEGQHQLGTIFFSNAETGGNTADAWLLEPEGRSSGGDLYGLDEPPVHMTLYGDERFKPFIILHELGHYLYGLADEYSGPCGEARCIGDKKADACIMEGGWQDGDRFGRDGDGKSRRVRGRIREFCASINHNAVGGSWQQTINHESCWTTMARRYPLQIPAGKPAATAAAGKPGKIDWRDLDTEGRYVLAVDRSSGMLGDRLFAATAGIDWWEETAPEGEWLGVVSFAGTATVNYPLQSLRDQAGREDLRAASAYLRGIEDRDSPDSEEAKSIVAGLEVALAQLQEATNQRRRRPAATQAIVLVTDGLTGGDDDPTDVLRRLREERVQVHVVGTASGDGLPLLQRIASATGGTFLSPAVRPAGDADASRRLASQTYFTRTSMQLLSGLARNNSGLVAAFEDVLGKREPANGPAEYKVRIEVGSQRAKFVVTWRDQGDDFDVRLVAPRGEPLVGSLSDRSVTFQEDQPQPGEWTLQVQPRQVTAAGVVHFLVFSENPRIDGGLYSSRQQYTLGEDIGLRLTVRFDHPLIGLRIRGTVRLPNRAPSSQRAPLEFAVGNPAARNLVSEDGVYHASFHPEEPGIYQFEATAESVMEQPARYAEEGEKLVDRHERERLTQSRRDVPPFRRRFYLSVIVVKPGVEAGGAGNARGVTAS